MTDRELLELAARGAGLRVVLGKHDSDAQVLKLDAFYLRDSTGRRGEWNPLADDGDALRLAVKLNLLVLPYPDDKAVRVTRLDQPDTIVSWGAPPDSCAATRRAIVRAAAEIGKSMDGADGEAK